VQTAWVLHRRPYRETSALVELLTADGRQRCVIRGKGRDALLSPFVPLMVELGPLRDLRNLKQIEAVGPALGLNDQRLFCGLYINELCVRLLPEQDPNPQLMAVYGDTLIQLSRAQVEVPLRIFEIELLSALGFSWSVAELEDGLAVNDNENYWVHPETGPRRAPAGATDSYSGQILKQVQAREFDRPGVLLAAKRLNRARLAALLGTKPLQSRQLLQGIQP